MDAKGTISHVQNLVVLYVNVREVWTTKMVDCCKKSLTSSEICMRMYNIRKCIKYGN